MSGANIATRIQVYVLAKNEEANIARCLDSVCPHDLDITVLDSGSTDRTADIASRYSKVKVVPYAYESHCVAGNEICTSNLGSYEYVMMLDADMAVSAELIAEVDGLTRDRHWDVVRAPVKMCVEGLLLSRGSLCPPKAFVFKAGRAHLVPSGHGEALQKDCLITQTHCSLSHDDRKAYEAYLMSQVRYARNLLSRGRTGAVSIKDLVRMNTPLMMFIVPVVSYFLRLGLLSGKAGLIYAIDRLIAEAIMFRQSLSERR